MTSSKHLAPSLEFLLQGIQGIHTQRISERRTHRPRRENSADGRSGDTSITRHGRKWRRFENGLKKAMPRPPLVIPSSSPWEATLTSSTQNVTAGCAPTPGASSDPTAASVTLNGNEWVKPRWPRAD